MSQNRIRGRWLFLAFAAIAVIFFVLLVPFSPGGSVSSPAPACPMTPENTECLDNVTEPAPTTNLLQLLIDSLSPSQ